MPWPSGRARCIAVILLLLGVIAGLLIVCDCGSAPAPVPVVVIQTGALPSEFDWRKTLGALPDVGDQGDVKSCIAWSTSYATDFLLKRFVRTSWNLSNAAERLSPAYLYNLALQYGEGPALGDTVSLAADLQFSTAFEMLTEFGVSTEAKFPYTIVYDQHPVQAAMDEAATLRKDLACVTLGWIFVAAQPDADDWKPIKQKIVDVGPVLFLIELYSDFGCGVGKDYTGPVTGLLPAGKHSLLCVGYDDNHVRDSDGLVVPSFVFMNSFGESWGDKGFVWIPYDKIRKPSAGVVVQVYFPVVPPSLCPEPAPGAYPFPLEWSEKPSLSLWPAEGYDQCSASYTVAASTAAPENITPLPDVDKIIIRSPAVPLIPVRLAGSMRFVDVTGAGPGGAQTYSLKLMGADRNRVGSWQQQALLTILDRKRAPNPIRYRVEVLDARGKTTVTKDVTIYVR